MKLDDFNNNIDIVSNYLTSSGLSAPSIPSDYYPTILVNFSRLITNPQNKNLLFNLPDDPTTISQPELLAIFQQISSNIDLEQSLDQAVEETFLSFLKILNQTIPSDKFNEIKNLISQK